MIKTFHAFAIAAISLTPTLYAQASGLELRVQQDSTATIINEESTISFVPASVGATAAATLTITNRRETAVTIEAISITGSADFTLQRNSQLPTALSTGAALNIAAQYNARTSQRNAGRITVVFSDGQQSRTFNINLAGITAEFQVVYIIQPGGNPTTVPAGGAVTFPATLVNNITLAEIVILNRGTAAASIDSVNSTGAAFQLTGLPILPAVLEPGRELRFTARFAPREIGPAQGSLVITSRGSATTVALSGSGTTLTYDIIRDSEARRITLGQAIQLPEAAVGQKTSVVVRVGNPMTTEARIESMTLSGSGFEISNTPFLPVTIAPGASTSFTLTFAPTQPGQITARLRIGADTFDVTGTAIGAALRYSFGSGSTTNPVANNGSVVFTAVPVGQSSALTFNIANSGTAPATVNAIGTTGSTSVFQVVDVPPLPVIVAPGSTVSFSIVFTPNNTGILNGGLRIDTDAFSFTGQGTPPTVFPDYKLDAPDTLDANQQPTLTLVLNRPYPVPLTGTLNLGFDPDNAGADPALQFATGGRSVAFTIPAGSTQAVFANNTNQVRFQTGTVAGNIRVAPQFATDAGLNVTPASAPAYSKTLAATAPRLTNVQVSSPSPTTLVVQISGYATNRSVQQIIVRFTAASGINLTAAEFPVRVDSAFAAWYQSAQSLQFGSQFSASLTFNLQPSNLPATTAAAAALRSLSVTATNEVGASNTLSTDIR